MADTTILDASVILAVVNGEDGSRDIQPYLQDGLLSAVNAAEVAARLTDFGMPIEQIRQTIQLLGVQTVPFTEDQAMISGSLRPHSRAAGLSLGDRACLALAVEYGGRAVTADRAWHGLELGVEIKVIR